MSPFNQCDPELPSEGHQLGRVALTMHALVLLCLSDSPFRYSSSRRPLMFFNLLLSHGSLLTFLGIGPFTVPAMSSSLSSEDIYFSASGDEKISLAFALSVSERDVVDFCRVERRLASF